MSAPIGYCVWSPYMWPIGCLTLIGAIHAGFAIESAILAALRSLTKGLATWR